MNPYSEHETPVVSMNDLFGNYVPLKRLETGWDYVEYFADKTGYEKGRVAFFLKGMLKDTRTLAKIKSECAAYENEGKGSFGKAFQGTINRIWSV